MDRDFEIGSRKFKLNRIDAFKQFHIVRRMGPVLADLLPAMKDIARSNAENSDQLDQVAKFLAPVVNGLSKLSDQDADKVLLGLLSSVEMQQSQGGWARVANDSMIMMQDLELPALFEIAGRAFVFNLSGFFSVPLQK